VHEIVVLIPGYAGRTREGKLHAGCTVTLIKGETRVVVDTGAPAQRQELLDALDRAGVQPADVQYVVNSHGHLDHIGNNNLFPGATFVLDGDIARNDEYWTHDFAHGSLQLGAATGQRAIEVIPTPGHTDHDLTVMVRTDAGLVAIVGDLFEYEGDWLDHSWEAWSKHRELQQQLRDKVFAAADFIVPGHGPMFRVPRAPTPR
jgi:glyoxylase-like metal-dependent hydrolase (beta-lactamase superfamily II)